MKPILVGLIALPAVAGAAGLTHALIKGPMVLEPEAPEVTVIPGASEGDSTPQEPARDAQTEPRTERDPGSEGEGVAVPETETDPSAPAGDAPLVLDTLEIELGVAATLFERGLADFIDARPRSEYEAGHILGAMNITPGMFIGSTPSVIAGGFLTEDRPIVVYCGGGDCDDSHVVVQRLQELGFRRAHVYTGGFPEWQAAELPTGSGPDPFAG